MKTFSRHALVALIAFVLPVSVFAGSADLTCDMGAPTPAAFLKTQAEALAGDAAKDAPVVVERVSNPTKKNGPGMGPVGDKTAYMRNPALPPPKLSVSVDPCCAEFDPSHAPALDPNYAAEHGPSNPYYSGPTRDLNQGYTPPHAFAGQDFEYVRPSKMGGESTIKQTFEYKIPPKGPTETDAEYLERRMNAIVDPEKSYPGRNVKTKDLVTFIDGGSQSEVYYVHPPMPDDASLKALYPDKKAIRYEFGISPSRKERSLEELRRLKWAREHATEVVKLRTPTPWGKELTDAARTLKRDLVMQGEFERASAGFHYTENGQKKQIVRVVKYDQTEAELSQGVLRQPATRGPTAYDIYIQIQNAKSGKEAAIKWLKKQGFNDARDASTKLGLLEEFYFNTHDDVVAFEYKNGLITYANSTGIPHVDKAVGFDYNHGVNVSWNAKDGIFEAFDF
jgi:hypothetical protein